MLCGRSRIESFGAPASPTGEEIAVANVVTGCSTSRTTRCAASAGPKPLKSTVSSVIAVRTSRINRCRDRPLRWASAMMPTTASELAGAEHHAVQRLELLENLARADRDGVERFGGQLDRHAGFVGEPLVDAL